LESHKDRDLGKFIWKVFRFTAKSVFPAVAVYFLLSPGGLLSERLLKLTGLDFSSLAFPLTLVILGLAVIRAGNLTGREWIKRVLAGLGVFIMGVAQWKAAVVLSEKSGLLYHGVISTIRFGDIAVWSGNVEFQIGFIAVANVFLVGLLFVAVALTLSCLSNFFKSPVASEVSEWLYSSQLRNFLYGLLLGAYFILARPILYAMFQHIVLIEWGIISVMVARAYSGFRYRMEQYTIKDVAVPTWRKHTQLIGYRGDGGFEALRRIQELFIETSHKGPLLITLTLLLSQNRLTVIEIDRILRPLIDYYDREPPLLAFRWEKERVYKKNRERRVETVRKVMAVIQERFGLPGGMMSEK